MNLFEDKESHLNVTGIPNSSWGCLLSLNEYVIQHVNTCKFKKKMEYYNDEGYFLYGGYLEVK